jgi:hypothetical protein
VRSKRHHLAAAVTAFALAVAPAVARADDPPTFISLGPLYYQSTTYIDTGGRVRPSSCAFEKTGESIYAQQQLAPGDQLRMSTEYDTDRCGGPSTQGLYDIEIDYLKGIGGRAHPARFQLEGGAIVPPGYSIAANPRIGFGRPGAQLGMMYNGNFKAGSLDGYLVASIAARGYTGYPAPQLLSNVTAGLHLNRALLFYESFYGTTHLGAGGVLTNIGLNPTVNAVYDSYTLSENVALSFTPRTALALTYQSQLGGWNTGIGTTVQAGLWQRF